MPITIIRRRRRIISSDETDKTKLCMFCERNETTEHTQFIPFNLYLPFYTFVLSPILSPSPSIDCSLFFSLIPHQAHIVLCAVA